MLVWRKSVRDADNNRLFQRSDLLVLLLLSMHMNSDGGGAFPSVKTMAAEAGLSQGQVRRSLAHAVTNRYLFVEKRGGRRGDGTTHSNRYRAIVPIGDESQPRTEELLSESPPESQPRTGEQLGEVSTAHSDDLNRAKDPSQPRTTDGLPSPVIEVDQIEGGSSLEERAAALVIRNREEVGPLLNGVIAECGLFNVEDAVATLENLQAGYTFARELMAAIKKVIDTGNFDIAEPVESLMEQHRRRREAGERTIDTWEDEDGRLQSRVTVGGQP